MTGCTEEMASVQGVVVCGNFVVLIKDIEMLIKQPIIFFGSRK